MKYGKKIQEAANIRKKKTVNKAAITAVENWNFLIFICSTRIAIYLQLLVQF